MISHKYRSDPLVAPSKLQRLWSRQTLIVIMPESLDTNFYLFYFVFFGILVAVEKTIYKFLYI
jgi:hypothetical protein